MNAMSTELSSEQSIILPPEIEDGFAMARRAIGEAGSPEFRLQVFGECCQWAYRQVAGDLAEKIDVTDRLAAIAEAARLDNDAATAAMAKAVKAVLERPAADQIDDDAFDAFIDGTTGSGPSLTPRAEADQWPQPLGADAYHGIAGELVRAIEPHTEADNVAVLIQFLAAFGNVCGRRAYIQIEGDRHPAQLWCVLVGKSAKARKGTSWGRVRQPIAAIDPVWANAKIITGLSTGEGIVYAVRDAVVSEGEGSEKANDPGVDDKRLLVIESEFASPLRHIERPGNILSSTLRALWDTGCVGQLTKNSPTKTTGAHVGIVGHIVDQELRRYLSRTERANGLANRFLFGMVRRSKSLPFGGGDFDPAPFVDRLREARERAWPDQRIGWADDGAADWEAVYDELSEGKAGLAGAVTSRAETQVLRLALTYCLLDGEAAIGAAHVRAALAVWRYCEQSAGIIFGSLTGNPVADDILQMLKAAPNGVTRTDIRDAFGRHKSSETIGAALQELVVARLARVESRRTAGRPEERWFPL